MIEKKIVISETDMVNGGEVLVVVAYAVKEDENLYAFPAPQVFNDEVYQRNKAEYDKAIQEFRASCI
jgi:hypothetical protein